MRLAATQRAYIRQQTRGWATERTNETSLLAASHSDRALTRMAALEILARELAMNLDIPDDPWSGEIFRRTHAGESEDAVRLEVFTRYLDACDPRPLVAAIEGGRKSCLTVALRRRIAACFDEVPPPDMPVQAIFKVEFGNKRGAPLKPQSLNEEQSDCRDVLLRGCEKLSLGKAADLEFWRQFAAALRLGHPEKFDPPATAVAGKIRMKFRSLANRPRDPFLADRNKAVAWTVSKRIKGGMTTTAAFKVVAEEVRLSDSMVRDIYYKRQ